MGQRVIYFGSRGLASAIIAGHVRPYEACSARPLLDDDVALCGRAKFHSAEGSDTKRAVAWSLHGFLRCFGSRSVVKCGTPTQLHITIWERP
jgi:hypothetical protein